MLLLNDTAKHLFKLARRNIYRAIIKAPTSVSSKSNLDSLFLNQICDLNLPAPCRKIIPKILLGVSVNHAQEEMVMCLAICVKGKFPLVQIRRIEALDPLKNTLKTDLGRIIQC